MNVLQHKYTRHRQPPARPSDARSPHFLILLNSLPGPVGYFPAPYLSSSTRLAKSRPFPVVKGRSPCAQLGTSSAASLPVSPGVAPPHSKAPRRRSPHHLAQLHQPPAFLHRPRPRVQ